MLPIKKRLRGLLDADWVFTHSFVISEIPIRSESLPVVASARVTVWMYEKPSSDWTLHGALRSSKELPCETCLSVNIVSTDIKDMKHTVAAELAKSNLVAEWCCLSEETDKHAERMKTGGDKPFMEFWKVRLTRMSV